MKNTHKIIIIFLLFAVGIISFIQVVRERVQPVDQFYTVSTMDRGNTLVTWYDERDITIAMVNHEGKIMESVNMPIEKDGLIRRVTAACVGEDNRVYLLMDSLDNLTGQVVEQNLVVYQLGDLLSFPTMISTSRLNVVQEESEEKEEEWNYQWLNVTGNVLSIIGVNGDETRAIRQVFEFGTITDKGLNVKSERIYPLAQGEGIYQATGNGTDLVYASNSGKVYHATETKVREIYPAREVKEIMYPLYITYAQTGYVYIQDGESGDIVRLNIMDGSEEVLMRGSAAFSLTRITTPRQIRMMSMNGLTDFSSVIEEEEGYALLVLVEGNGYLINEMTWPITVLIPRFLLCFLRYGSLIGIAILLLYGIYRGITRGKTIIGKLLLAALPLLIIVMSAFGIIAYIFYRDAVLDSYRKQTIDEGNMMTALFGAEAFHALEYPYDYNSEDYRYLWQQMAGRNLHARIIYFEDGELYTGVAQGAPCFYPNGIYMNSSLDSMYRRAALSGETITGRIRDRIGERMVSVTPVGGSSGRSVYLYETGIYAAQAQEYQSSYIRNFVLICTVFLLVLSVLLGALFLQILDPLDEIRQGMEEFTRGRRDIRIVPETRDELAGICHAFNRMADDIELQLVNLRNLSETYYRFMPLSIIAILGKDNLGSLTLGSHTQGNYAVLSVHFRSIDSGDSFVRREETVNRFFEMLNSEAVRQNAVPIVDSANLSSILLICKEGVASAIRTALAILGAVDAYNAGRKKEEQLDISFLLHRSDIFVGICGDKKRYIPVLLTPELEELMTYKEVFVKVGSRLVVTSQAFSELGEETEFENRYIGQLGIRENKGGFYEFYGDRDAHEAHGIRLTLANFRKAMKLFEEGYFYEAKNLFTMVLQDNPDDMVVKYYIFRCD